MTTVAANGVDFNVVDAGAGEPVIVFLHGLACDATAWDPQVEDLSRDHRVVAINLRGRGATAAMPPFDIEQQAADVAAILDALGVGSAIVVGHSLGGVVALVLNDRRPDLVTGLLLGDSPVRSGGLDGSRLVQSIREDGPEAAKALVENFWSDSTSDDVKDRVRGMMLPCPPDVLCGMLEMAPSAERMLELVRLADSKPFMTIWAERPAGDPAWLRDTTMFIRQEPMAGAGHFFQLERPDVTNALIRAFIEETARDPRIDSQRG